MNVHDRSNEIYQNHLDRHCMDVSTVAAQISLAFAISDTVVLCCSSTFSCK